MNLLERKSAIGCLLTILFPWSSSIALAQGPFPGPITLRFTQNAYYDGSLDYTLGLTVQTWPGWQVDTLAIAPDGTELRFDPVNLQPQLITVTSFEELQNRFFGDWTIREEPRNPSEEISTYAFAIESFNYSEVFHEVPQITSPADESTVPSSFLVSWEFPSGAAPSFRAIAWLPGGARLAGGFGPLSTNEYQFEVDLNELYSRPLSIRVGSGTDLRSNVGPVSLVSGPRRTDHSFVTRPAFIAFSPLVTLNVVPETSCICTGAIGFLLCCGTRIRRTSGFRHFQIDPAVVMMQFWRRLNSGW